MSLLFLSLLTIKHCNCYHRQVKQSVILDNNRLALKRSFYSPFLVSVPRAYFYGNLSSCRTQHTYQTWSMCEQKQIEIQKTIKTNGGWMFEVEVNNNQQLSRHTVLLGKGLFEELVDRTDNNTPETVITTVFNYLIERNVVLKNTQGVFDSSQFPINYFSVRQLFYFYPDCKEYLKQTLASTRINQ
ncbi:hypothetical protein GpartN1_g2307.t1 [Galdieria partita]|uniref:Uncharacterized protein n=1 Tax=Galdieria partita TaxID=83374 RepID=A0A9C7PV55_9RHOD|nr:hypothetical protein GpartN1_g2307.t1 [Galdieria partita]